VKQKGQANDVCRAEINEQINSAVLPKVRMGQNNTAYKVYFTTEEFV